MTLLSSSISLSKIDPVSSRKEKIKFPCVMNSKSEGVAVALVGKVPCKVEGFIEKGDLLTTSGNNAGHAKKAIEPKLGSIIGKALEDHKSAGQGVIFVSVGKH